MKTVLMKIQSLRLPAMQALLACAVLAACAGKTRFVPESREFYGMKRGEILYVHTLDGKTNKVVYQFITEDSLLANPRSFRIDSVKSIEKEEVSVGKTAALGGGLYVAAATLGVLIAVGITSVFSNVFAFLG